MIKSDALPELLCPAGSPTALRAAIEGGADAVYFGGRAFNARMRAENFTPEVIRESVNLCHAYGVRAYLTLNTLVTDRELPSFLQTAAEAYEAGIDALIVADLGGAAALHRMIPQLELHASTQMSGHSLGAGVLLKELGFTRMVLARETNRADMARFVRESGVETEVFVHGALCVSHSGQCLFSSLVGGRSGNRGECAQPCRLPDAMGRYPLSLKDLCLARHVTELIAMGVDSLKIEGRLKSPEYVRDVARIWRRLLDERRDADEREMTELASVFSRGGFTDGYFTGKIGPSMLGVRSENDKQSSREAEPFSQLSRRVPLTMHFVMQTGKPLSLSVTANGKTATVMGDIPLIAERAPMDRAAVEKNLCRLGGTPYAAEQVLISMDEGLMVPLSRLNALRRAAIEALEGEERSTKAAAFVPSRTEGERVALPSARFEDAAQITKEARDYFSHIYLPLERFSAPADGVVLPPVIFDHEREAVLEGLQAAVKAGARHALVGNIGHLELANAAGLVAHGDFRLNITNRETLATLLELGFADCLLSPELTLPQIRDIDGAADVIVYGRIPLMLLEKCVGKEVGNCDMCRDGVNYLVDRRGERFPVLRLAPHRNLLCNSRPTVMSDRRDELLRAGIVGGHYIFTTETAREVDRVLAAYREGAAPKGQIRRI